MNGLKDYNNPLNQLFCPIYTKISEKYVVILKFSEIY